MGFWKRFPYTNFHEINLDWIIKKLVQLEEKIDSGGGGGSAVNPYDSDPQPLGNVSPGSSADYARGDHVHPKPSAADLGVIAAPANPASGDFLMWDGSAWTAQSIQVWTGGDY